MPQVRSWIDGALALWTMTWLGTSVFLLLALAAKRGEDGFFWAFKILNAKFTWKEFGVPGVCWLLAIGGIIALFTRI
jgi:hypothetical protein